MYTYRGIPCMYTLQYNVYTLQCVSNVSPGYIQGNSLCVSQDTYREIPYYGCTYNTCILSSLSCNHADYFDLMLYNTHVNMKNALKIGLLGDKHTCTFVNVYHRKLLKN